MSKNHPHDNIYSILGKLEALQPTTQEQHDAKVQQIRESVESQGSILKGLRDVSSVEQRLAKQFAESDFSKLSNKIQKSGKSKASADAIAASIGREKLGQKEMTRRSVAGRKDEAVRVAGNTKGPVGHYSQMKYAKKDGSPEAQAHRDDTAAMAKSARAAGSKLPFNKTTDPSGKLASGGYNAMAKGVTPVKTAEDTCNECGMTLEGCGCDHTNEDMSRAAKGHEKYGKEGMQALAKAGRDGAGEEKLDTIRDKYDRYDEGEVTRKPGVTTHRKTDFPGYPVDDYADSETERTSKRGRPLKAQTKKPRVDPNAPKKGRGRPKADKPLGHGAPKMHDPFGRVPTGASKIKGTRGSVHSMDEAMATMSQRFTRIVEGVNFRAMAEETNQTIDELMMELQQDINNYKTSGHCSDKLKDFLMVHSHAKKQMADEAVNPNNPFYKKQNDYDFPPAMRGHGTADYKLPDTKAHDNINRDDYRDRAGLDPLHNELNELARLAGIQDEGNAFTGKLKDTPKGGKFDLDGKTYTDTSGLDEDPEAEFEGNAFTGKLKDTAKGDKFDLDGKEYTDTSTLDEEPNEGNEFSGALAKAKANHADKFEVDGKEYPVKEADVSVDDAGANPVNKPKAKYYSMKASTMNPGEGDAGEKAMHANKPTFKNGDNPLSKTAVTPVKEATLSLEARLAAEYESIKKVSK